MQKIIVFLPCRKGSQRIKKKNIRPFAGVEGGLLRIKLEQLISVKNIHQIVLSTNDPEVIAVAQQISKSISIDIRPDHLGSSETSTDDLIKYIPTIIHEGHILWTHTTSPFLGVSDYERAIEIYHEILEKGTHDSLMTVNKLQTFLWDSKGSYNYDRSVEKWPRTQTLPKLFEVNSGLFINSRDHYIKYEDRIGNKPYLLQTEGISSFDIDWPDDFKLGEQIFHSVNSIK